MLEAMLWQNNCYLTLSYREDALSFTVPRPTPGGPVIRGVNACGPLATLNPTHVQLFLKRLRKAYGLPMRFFCVGEYGDVSWRPHYHLALFNFPTCERSRTVRIPGSSRPRARECCSVCCMVHDTWGLGDVDLGMLEAHSAQYVAGYVTKKLTGVDDVRLLGRYPEFARMSLRPGIGYGVLQNIAATLVGHGVDIEDVPTCLRHGKKLLPLGRYLRRKLRVVLGRDERCPDEVIVQLQEEMRVLRESVAASTSHPTMARFRKEVLKNAIIDANMGLKWQSEEREARQKKRRF